MVRAPEGEASAGLLLPPTEIYTILLPSGIPPRDLEERGAVSLAVGTAGVLAYLAVHGLVDNLFVQGIYILPAIWLALLRTGTWYAETTETTDQMPRGV